MMGENIAPPHCLPFILLPLFCQGFIHLDSAKLKQTQGRKKEVADSRQNLTWEALALKLASKLDS